MKTYLVSVSLTMEVDAEDEDDAVEKASGELREYKPDEFDYNVSEKGGEK